MFFILSELCFLEGLKVDFWVMLRSKFRNQVSVMVHVINNGGVVTLEQRLHEEANRPDHTHTHKDPQEETVNHHGYVLPVFNDLQGERERSLMLTITIVVFTKVN